MPMITKANDNINKAFPWVFLLISMFDPYGHLRFISSSTCNRESKPDMRKAAKQPVFSPMVPHTRRLDLVKQNKQNCSCSLANMLGCNPPGVFSNAIFTPEEMFKSSYLHTFVPPTPFSVHLSSHPLCTSSQPLTKSSYCISSEQKGPLGKGQEM